MRIRSVSTWVLDMSAQPMFPKLWYKQGAQLNSWNWWKKLAHGMSSIASWIRTRFRCVPNSVLNRAPNRSSLNSVLKRVSSNLSVFQRAPKLGAQPKCFKICPASEFASDVSWIVLRTGPLQNNLEDEFKMYAIAILFESICQRFPFEVANFCALALAWNFRSFSRSDF